MEDARKNEVKLHLITKAHQMLLENLGLKEQAIFRGERNTPQNNFRKDFLSTEEYNFE